jgi:hypothetical protein
MLGWCLRGRNWRRSRCGCRCGCSLLLFFFLSEAFESLINHLFREPLPAQKDALLVIGDLLQVLTAEEDGGNGDQLLVLLQLL